jgi:putative flippase GtrA
MSVASTAAADVPATSLGTLGLLLRHQAGAIFVTILDFSTMSLLVQALGTSAVAGTIAGAAVGGVTNFVIGRRLIFGATEGSGGGQALRYAIVSLASLTLNAAGEYLLHDRLGLQFQLARICVAALVSVTWNFPMHRHFVFPRPHAQP